MSTPVNLGVPRQLWFANLTDATAQWSFLEDVLGTTKRAAQYGQTIRLGDPISLGPNSVWHQLTFEGGEGQDIWNDAQMYQWGDVDVLTTSGKARMWPGFQSWLKLENMGIARGVAMSNGTRTDTAQSQLVLYVGTRDHDVFEPETAAYYLYQIHPGYPRGDARAVQTIAFSNEPYRVITPSYDDTGANGIQNVMTRTHFYQLIEKTHTLVEDTGAPTNAGDYQWDSAAAFNEAFYYCRGNTLWKRLPKAPFGTVGTHTKVKQIGSALQLRGLTIWNNRIYFGSQYANRKASIYVSDGATTTKAFDFPNPFVIAKLKAVAGSLYILGHASSDLHGNNDPSGSVGNLVQQLWRYDGRSLKLLWQQGKFSDGAWRWFSDLAEWNGWVVWGRQGNAVDGGKANLMFYDPVRDAIARGPGINLDAANVGDQFGRGLWITGIHPWHSTLAVWMKDDTKYAHHLKGPGCLMTMRADNFIKNDLRWHTADQTGDVNQFKANINEAPQTTLMTSEYHGIDNVAIENKVWLSARLRVRFPGLNAHLQVYAGEPVGEPPMTLANMTQLADLSWASTGIADDKWHDLIVPLKHVDGTYFESQKIQLAFVFKNTAADYDNVFNPWLDDVAVSWTLAAKKVRQWQFRVACTEAQTLLDGTPNPLNTEALLAQKLEDLFFNGVPVKFWEPTTSAATPDPAAAIEVRIADYHRQESRLASDENSQLGYTTLTLVENVLT